MGSERFFINWDEFKKVGKNALIFVAPALIIFLTSIQAGNSLDDSLIALKVWLFNVFIDFLRKWIADNRAKQM